MFRWLANLLAPNRPKKPKTVPIKIKGDGQPDDQRALITVGKGSHVIMKNMTYVTPDESYRVEHLDTAKGEMAVHPLPRKGENE